MLHISPTNLILLAAGLKPYKKAYFTMKKLKNFLEKKVRRMDQWAEKKVSQRLRESKRGDSTEQMTALRCQTGGDFKYPASLW